MELNLKYVTFTILSIELYCKLVTVIIRSMELYCKICNSYNIKQRIVL